MNIAEAAREVRHAVVAYLAKDEAGRPLVPREMQRPLLIMGPPGIGKTAVCRQAAAELHVNFCAYAMTHHTRQSAIGLPFIDEATFGGEAHKVSRYTMSEIVAAAHDSVAASGVAEGILFLDEVNCVSETLAPAMLQFLQFKTFGTHALPDGWVVVCAANPRQYNAAARDFDAATLDRLRLIEVEPDLASWMAYATDAGVHPAVVGYLERRPEHFYVMRQDLDGTRMVTARGWDDLARAIGAYQAAGLPVGKRLVAQYLRDDDVVLDFSRHLELVCTYEEAYRTREIVDGQMLPASLARARQAAVDERLQVVALLAHHVLAHARTAFALEEGLRRDHDRIAARHPVADNVRAGHNERVRSAEATGRAVLLGVEAAFAFVDAAWPAGEEAMVLAARLTDDACLMHLAATYGSDALVAHAGALRFSERAHELIGRL